MSAVETLETLIRLGLKVKDAYTNSSKDWPAFLSSDDFRAIEADVNALLAQLKPDELQTAILAIQKKKLDLLGGKDVAALAPDKLLAYFDLLKVENVLVVKQLAAARISKQAFLTTLEHDVLPALVSVAKVVLPLLT